jgi:hypothetical protein
LAKNCSNYRPLVMMLSNTISKWVCYSSQKVLNNINIVSLFGVIKCDKSWCPIGTFIQPVPQHFLGFVIFQLTFPVWFPIFISLQYFSSFSFQLLLSFEIHISFLTATSLTKTILKMFLTKMIWFYFSLFVEKWSVPRVLNIV